MSCVPFSPFRPLFAFSCSRFVLPLFVLKWRRLLPFNNVPKDMNNELLSIITIINYREYGDSSGNVVARILSEYGDQPI